jgi:hypothetical protein
LIVPHKLHLFKMQTFTKSFSSDDMAPCAARASRGVVARVGHRLRSFAKGVLNRLHLREKGAGKRAAAAALVGGDIPPAAAITVPNVSASGIPESLAMTPATPPPPPSAPPPPPPPASPGSGATPTPSPTAPRMLVANVLGEGVESVTAESTFSCAGVSPHHPTKRDYAADWIVLGTLDTHDLMPQRGIDVVGGVLVGVHDASGVADFANKLATMSSPEWIAYHYIVKTGGEARSRC